MCENAKIQIYSRNKILQDIMTGDCLSSEILLSGRNIPTHGASLAAVRKKRPPQRQLAFCWVCPFGKGRQYVGSGQQSGARSFWRQLWRPLRHPLWRSLLALTAGPSRTSEPAQVLAATPVFDADGQPSAAAGTATCPRSSSLLLQSDECDTVARLKADAPRS